MHTAYCTQQGTSMAYLVSFHSNQYRRRKIQMFWAYVDSVVIRHVVSKITRQSVIPDVLWLMTYAYYYSRLRSTSTCMLYVIEWRLYQSRRGHLNSRAIELLVPVERWGTSTVRRSWFAYLIHMHSHRENPVEIIWVLCHTNTSCFDPIRHIVYSSCVNVNDILIFPCVSARSGVTCQKSRASTITTVHRLHLCTTKNES